jgi:hypothetical protein
MKIECDDTYQAFNMIFDTKKAFWKYKLLSFSVNWIPVTFCIELSYITCHILLVLFVGGIHHLSQYWFKTIMHNLLPNKNLPVPERPHCMHTRWVKFFLSPQHWDALTYIHSISLSWLLCLPIPRDTKTLDPGYSNRDLSRWYQVQEDC